MSLGGEQDVHMQAEKKNPSVSKEWQELHVNELGGRNTVRYTKAIPRIYSRELVPPIFLFPSIVLVKFLSS